MCQPCRPRVRLSSTTTWRAGQFGPTFGPTPATIAATRAWLTSSGLQPGPTSADGLLIPVTGSTAQLEQALDVSLVSTRLSDGRVARFAPQQPAVPSSLVPSVAGVIGLSTVATPEPQLVATPSGASTAAGGTGAGPVPLAVPSLGPGTCAAAANTGGYTATQLAAAYGFNSLYGAGLDGSGVTIGVYELEPYTPLDITNYKACYGITTAVNDVLVDGGAGTTTQQGEAALDVEDVIGLAPGATVKVYTGPQSGSGPIDTYMAMVNDPSLKVITTSWGLCEPQMAMQGGQQATESALFAQAAAQGQTVVAASGDSGSTDCYPTQPSTTVTVDDPADQPDVTGVGGTSLTSAGSPPAESVWDNFYGSGGGGVSSDFAQPSWQTGPGVDAPVAVTQCAALERSSCREVPDVSASSDPAHGYAIYWSFRGGTWGVVGGTSGASPLWAALIGVIDQRLAASPAGMVNPVLYNAGSCAGTPFNDITVGSNALLASSGGKYAATANYDVATGWGSPVGSRLLAVLSSPPVCPVVTGVLPSKGPMTGGNSVTVTGYNLSGATSVQFGGAPASFSVTSPTSLVARAPAGPAGTTADISVANADGSSPVVTADRYTFTGPGYWLVASDGGIFSFGHAPFEGSTGGLTLNKPVVGMAADSDDGGYWLVASDGGIFALGDAAFYGSTGGMHLNQPIVGMAATPTGHGYWLVASDGGIFSFGDAAFYGSTGGMHLNQPIVGMAATPAGHGYWLVARDGGIFSFGDASFYGSTGGRHLNQPVVGLAADSTGHGYWLVASDGGIFTFGDAVFRGGTGGMHLNQPIVGMAAGSTGGGYWLVARDGGIFSFGDASFYGSTGGMHLNQPIVGMAST